MGVGKQVELTSNAWFGDIPLRLYFPNSWKISVFGSHTLPPLTTEHMIAKIENPIGKQKIRELALKKQRVAIVIDDITRPTPTSTIIPIILKELKGAGVKHDYITVIIAGGTHSPATKDDIEKKLGEELAANTKVIVHDSKQNLVYLGKSLLGTPIYVNKSIVESDLIIGIGCIYPHPAAGFSGGSKIIVPGVCGNETARYLHDYIKGNKRGRISQETEIRQEMDDIASRVGLDFIINVVLNQHREVAGLFAGDKILAHRKGVQFATETFSIEPPKDIDIAIIDVYPFDMNFQFAHDRGLWQLEGLDKNVSKVIIAACPKGLGGHDLYPVNRPLSARISRRMKNLQLKEFRFLVSKVRAIKRIISLRNQRIIVFSTGLTSSELTSVFPKARLFDNWNEIIHALSSYHKEFPVKVALYQCAPYLVPIH